MNLIYILLGMLAGFYLGILDSEKSYAKGVWPFVNFCAVVLVIAVVAFIEWWTS